MSSPFELLQRTIKPLAIPSRRVRWQTPVWHQRLEAAPVVTRRASHEPLDLASSALGHGLLLLVDAPAADGAAASQATRTTLRRRGPATIIANPCSNPGQTQLPTLNLHAAEIRPAGSRLPRWFMRAFNVMANCFWLWDLSGLRVSKAAHLARALVESRDVEGVLVQQTCCIFVGPIA
jgi:hypothetical protein